MKTKQFKNIRGHVGYLCKLEGGKSEAKIHDAIQILNHHYDLILQEYANEGMPASVINDLAEKGIDYNVVNTVQIFMQAAAKRWLKKNKVKRK